MESPTPITKKLSKIHVPQTTLAFWLGDFVDQNHVLRRFSFPPYLRFIFPAALLLPAQELRYFAYVEETDLASVRQEAAGWSPTGRPKSPEFDWFMLCAMQTYTVCLCIRRFVLILHPDADQSIETSPPTQIPNNRLTLRSHVTLFCHACFSRLTFWFLYTQKSNTKNQSNRNKYILEFFEAPRCTSALSSDWADLSRNPSSLTPPITEQLLGFSEFFYPLEHSVI